MERQVSGDAAALPLEDAQFDAITISFGVRNVADVLASMREMYRVLNDGGKALILEFIARKSYCALRSFILFTQGFTDCWGSDFR